MNLITETQSNFEIVKNYFDWDVKKRDIFIKNPNSKEMSHIRNFQAVCRVDNDTTLGLVGKNYSVVNNNTILNILKPFIENKSLAVSSYISDKKGAVNYINLDYPEQIDIKNDPSPLKFGLSCIWGHGGQRGLFFLPYLGRLTCQNGMSTEGIFKSFSYKHSLNLPSRIPVIRQLLKSKLENLNSNVAKIINQVNTYQNIKMEQIDFAVAYKKYFVLDRNINKEESQKDLSTTQQTYFNKEKFTFTNLVDKYNNEFEQKTLWSAYNAFTEMITQPENKNPKKHQLKLITRNNNIERKLNIAKNVCDSYVKHAA